MKSRSASCPPTEIRDDITGVGRTKESYQVPLKIVTEHANLITERITESFNDIKDKKMKKIFVKSLQKAIDLPQTNFNIYQEDDNYKSLDNRHKLFLLSINQQVNGNLPAKGEPLASISKLFEIEEEGKIARTASFISSNLKTFLTSQLHSIYSYEIPNSPEQPMSVLQIDAQPSTTR